ncbi:SRPBCC family protein [Hypericibacter sp.]|uniref:SRPBCC family protein n=1 Tax=Hypericibacter sp. TaxID=2705401 RepID=UPI003D6CB011
MPVKAGNAAAAKPTERTITLTRVFAAPRETVFAAWTDARRIARWWAPNGFTIPHCEADPRPDGVFTLCMRWADKGDYWMRGHYREVVAPERLVIVATAYDAQQMPRLDAVVEVTLSGQAGETVLTLRTTARGSGDIAGAMLNGTKEGWNQSIDHLERHLADRP